MDIRWMYSDSDSDDNEEPDGENEKFLWAAGNGKLDIITELLERNPDLIKWKDEYGYTAMHRASSEGKVDVVWKLLEMGGDVDARTNDGWSPLHCACKWNNTETAALLLANAAHINAVTNGNNTPLHAAASEKGNADVLKLLLQNEEIDVTIVNDGGDTAFALARRTDRNSSLFTNAIEKSKKNLTK